MQILRTGSASALLLAAHACALAQSIPQPAPDAVQQVVVSAPGAAQREQSTTTTIVVGRDDILRQGDATLAEVLKRLPGVTVDAMPGKTATIRMHGMGEGYVAVLLNGSPAPTGFALDGLNPELVERIEIRRASTAETSGQAIAGTINVILRRGGASGAGAATTVKGGSAIAGGRAAPQLALEHDGRAGTLAYTLAGTLTRAVNPVAAVVTEAGERPALLRRTSVTDLQFDDTLELAPRLSWQPDARDTLTSQGYVRKLWIDHRKRADETPLAGAPSAFPHATERYATDPLQAYADAAWMRRLETGARLAVRLSGFIMRRSADFVYRGMDLRDKLLATHHVVSAPVEREWTLNVTWRRPLWDGHALAAGIESGVKNRTEDRHERQFDAAGRLSLASDEDYRARVGRRAVFVQDEWDVDADWSAYVGLRREDLHTAGAGSAHAPVDVGAGAWSPIFQALCKPQRGTGDASPRDQFRLAVSRTYKAPNIAQLMPRRYTVDNDNSAINADQQGNPNLRPELALGVDLAWERYVGEDAMVGVSAFRKRIRDVTLTRTYQNGGVWTATPVNGGGATVQGIEFEGRATYGVLSLRANLARNWSHVDSVPGPDNRSAGQVPASGNLGLDFAPAGKHLEAGGTLSWHATAVSRASAEMTGAAGGKRQLDLYAVWKRGQASRLRLSLTDALHPDVEDRIWCDGTSPLARATAYRARATWRLVWEQQ
jgi:outer membrane receptor protein involved in Fe transport